MLAWTRGCCGRLMGRQHASCSDGAYDRAAIARAGVVTENSNLLLDVRGIRIADPMAMESDVVAAVHRPQVFLLGTAVGVGGTSFLRRFTGGATPRPHPIPGPSTSPLRMRLRIARHGLRVWEIRLSSADSSVGRFHGRTPSSALPLKRGGS